MVKSLAKPVTYVSMVSKPERNVNLAKPMTSVSMVSELKEIKNFSKAGDPWVYGQRTEINK